MAGTIVATQNAYSDEEVEIRDYPDSRTGYTFNGWNTKSDGTGMQYMPGNTTYFDNSITLYAQWMNNSDVIGMKVVPVVDLSDSMSLMNITHAASAITAILMEHQVLGTNPSFVNLSLYYGRDPSSLDIANDLVSKNFAENSDLKIFNSVRSQLLNQSTVGDKQMLSTLYAAISQTMSGISLSSRTGGLNAVVFSVMTDEKLTVGLSSQLNVNLSSYDDDSNWWNTLKNSNEWIKNWQKFDNPARFPDNKSSYDEFGQSSSSGGTQWTIHFYMSRILKALKAMSYYYGINFGICYAGDDCLYSNFASGSHRYFYDGNAEQDSSGAPTQTELQDATNIIPYTLPATPTVRKYQSTTNGVTHDANGNIVWEDGANDQDIEYSSPTSWKRGMYAVANKQKESTCSRLDWYTNLDGKTYRRIIYPGNNTGRDSNLYPAVLGSPMCKIVIQSGYRLDSSRVISPEDLYTDAKYDKFHDMGGQYVAYKYFDFTDFDYEYNSWMEYTRVPNAHNSITLPGQNEINTPSGKTLSGWEVVKSGGNIPIGNGQYSPLESHAVNGVVTLAPVFVE